MSYDPNSVDAMFAKILQSQAGQDAALARIEEQVRRTNGRVNGLESWRDIMTARIAVVSSVVSGLVAAIAWGFKLWLA
jgi:hypothetical protein